MSLTRNEPVEVSDTHEAAPAQAPRLLPVRISSADAELVVARAIAEHEMRRP